MILPREAPWLGDFRGELRAFPHRRHDDQADSFSEFVKHKLTHWRWLLTEYEPDGRVCDLVRIAW